MKKSACAKVDPRKVAEVLAGGGEIKQALGEMCPACGLYWNVTHMLVSYEVPDELTAPESTKDREKRQLSIILLEMAEEFFLLSHQWVKLANGFFQPPKNYRFRKKIDGHYDRSHAVNSQKQVYNPLYAHEKQWEGEAACGRKVTL